MFLFRCAYYQAEHSKEIEVSIDNMNHTVLYTIIEVVASNIANFYIDEFTFVPEKPVQLC